MSWIDIVWPMSGAVSLTLGMIHLSIWLHQRSQWTHLAFSLAAFGVSTMAIIELMSFRATSPDQYATLVRWAHIPFSLTMASLVTYVHLRFKESRKGLAVLAAGARMAVLIPNFLTGQNLNFQSVDSIAKITVIGEQITAPVGVANPWMILGQTCQLLMAVYLVDVIIRTWRAGDREQRTRALVVCGSILLFILSNNTLTILVVLGIVRSPLVVNMSFIFVILVMSYELGGNVLRAASLSRNLQVSQRELLETERRLRLAAQSGGMGLWLWRGSAGGTWLTDNGKTLLGLSPGQRIDWTALLQRVHPDDVPGMLLAREEALNGAPYTCEFRFRNDDGDVRWLVARGRSEIDDVDEGPGVIRGVLQDVTERRLAEERFPLVVENAPYAILLVDVDGRIVLANARAERLFGYDRAELASLDVDQLVPPELLDSQGGLRTLFAAAPPAASSTLALRHKDGQDVPVEIALTPLWMQGDQYTITSIVEISEKLAYEQQATLQREELAHLSRIALLGEISGSLAHELNQPLSAVLSNAQAALRFMQHDPPNLAEVRDSLLHIVESDKRASEIIRRLRAMMRKDAAEHETMDVNEIVRESLQLLNADLIHRGVTPSLDPSPDLPRVMGDAVQLKQVMLNLMVNACDAMRDSATQRLLVVRTLSHAGGTVEISVSDNGSGIAEADLESIFTPFVTTKAEGIGLGLAICRTLMQAQGGRLWARNNGSGGATFHVLLAAEGNQDARHENPSGE